ncbi:hypothetical protein H4219_003953, partial [Mycoemilia scoparia]
SIPTAKDDLVKRAESTSITPSKPLNPFNSWERKFICELNKARKSKGLNPLVSHTALHYQANSYSKWLTGQGHYTSKMPELYLSPGEKLPNGDRVPQQFVHTDGFGIDTDLGAKEIVNKWLEVTKGDTNFMKPEMGAIGVGRIDGAIFTFFYMKKDLPKLQTYPVKC